ncbi:hypothetical protein, partial [Aeromonas veronii]|uniref:hypothetical protein n=1 Tax=Aeromonas veronii TaxID=654 RepID=UPI001F2FDDA8
IAGVEEVEGLFDTHKKSETNQQVSDFHTTEGSVNGSLTDQHYLQLQAPFVALPRHGGSLQQGKKPMTLVRHVHRQSIITVAISGHFFIM